MEVSKKAMDEYRRKLSAIDTKCADEVLAYMTKRRFIIDNDFVRYAHAIQEKYGEAAGELACQMYDSLAESYMRKGRKYIKPAEPAQVATMQEVAKTVYGTAKKSLTEIPQAVSLLAKRTAQDTTLQNALRDEAQFAWVPSGDTCAFCRMLGSNGFRRMSKKALKNGHAEHIHANCDCTYVIRFDSSTTYEGYDPQALKQDYDEYGLRGMERKIYADNKDAINARRRELYAEKHIKFSTNSITLDNCNSVEDVEAYAKSKNYFYSETFEDGRIFNGNEAITFAGADVETAKTIARASDTIFEKYPKFIGELNNASVGHAAFGSNGTWANCFFGLGRGGITVDIRRAGNFERFNRAIIYAGKTGSNMPRGNLFTCVTHEYGHAIDDYLTNILHLNKGETVSADIRKRVMSRLRGKVNVKDELGTYATKNSMEWFAEAFSDYIASDNPSIISKEVGKELEEILKGANML